MDLWESTIEDYHQSQTLDSLSTVLHTAEGILKQDLAQFELDWFIQTLLSEPVTLLDIISLRSSDDAWSKVVKDAYKLLGDIVEKNYDAVQEYMDSIIEQCTSPQDARTRSHALQCLSNCLKRAQPGELASQFITELRQASTCKAPLALLVGTICEYHPEIVADQFNTIWRTYLNLLASNKNSDLVCKSLLKGVWCLFKHFGSDIQMNEITNFYDKLADEYLKKCPHAVIPILRDYSPLFKERLASDSTLRQQLWLLDDFSSIIPVYEQVASVMTGEQIQNMLLKEVIPKTTESYTKLKFTALRVCIALKQNVSGDVDVYSLEYQLRKEVTNEVAEAVSWCIESNMLNSEKLLQTAIMFYHNLPDNKKKEIVVNGLLNSQDNVMLATLNFLISESCQENSLHTYIPLWNDIFASNHTKKEIVFDKFLENVLLVIENFLDDFNEDKKIPDNLARLLTLTSYIIPMQDVDLVNYQLTIVASKLVELSQECGLEACVISVVKVLVPLLESRCHLDKICQTLQTDRCKDEATLCETCLTLLEVNERSNDIHQQLEAIEVILSRKDAEPKTLSMAIKKIEEEIILCKFDSSRYYKCITLIEKLRTRKDLVGKDARVLQRDITSFLGKYSNSEYANESAVENSLIVQLKEVLSLDIPNATEGITYKIHLNRLLHLAVTNEHEETLRMLLNIICANLCNRSCPLLQAALGRVVAALCRATVGAPKNDARHAAAFCDVDSTVYILQQISQVKSPAVRRMLADAIEGILLKEPGSEANERILSAVFQEVCGMMKSDSSILKLGGLEISESLLTALKMNRHQTKSMLPTLLLLISKTNEQDSHVIFENASELYIENRALFSANALDIAKDLIINILDSKELKTKIYKDIVKSTVKFISKLIDCTEVVKMVLDLQNDCVKFMYVLSEISKSFDLNGYYVKELLDFDNGVILNAVFNANLDDGFALEANLRFLNQFASSLLKFHNEATLKHLSSLIENLTSEHVKSNWRLLSECLTQCRQICQNTPLVLLKSFEIWSESIPIKNITEHIEKEKFLKEHELYIHALNKMIDFFHLKDPTSLLTTVSIFAKTWPRKILKLFASDRFIYVKEHFTYLSVLLSVSLRFLTLTDVKNILCEGHSLDSAKNAKLGVEFCRFFMSVFIKYLVKKPFLLVHDGMESCWMLLNDVVKWCVRKRWHDDQLENVMELVDQQWPTYESKASFKDKHTLLLDLSCLNVKLPATSRPIRWVTGIVGANDAKREERIALVMVLPAGEEYSGTYRNFASLLPTRLSDMSGPAAAAFSALLDALAGNADKVLLDIVFTLADGDDTSGWWDEALSSCMASLASKASVAILPDSVASLEAMYARCRNCSPSVYRRLLIPYIRCSPSSVCEKFFACTLKENLDGLITSLKTPSLHPDYRTCVQQKTIALELFLVLIEKVPVPKIESPSSPLYEHIQTDKPWYLLGVLMRVCAKLRDKLVTPDGASDALSEICREFQYAAYKCMSACICMRRPDAKIYNTVFNGTIWKKIVDESVEYKLPLKSQWNRHKIRKPACIPVTGGKRLSGSATSRRRLFLRTLSENPMDHDLNEYHEIDTEITQDIELSDSSLNNHPCSATLTALCQHAASLAFHDWLEPVCEALRNAPRNVRWLLAMAICNSKEELKPHAERLLPALLAVIANTSQGTLNSLHIDILNTLIYWEYVYNIPHLNTSINYLVNTALENNTRPSIFKMLEDILENILKIYGEFVEGELKYFATNDDSKNKHRLRLLLRFVKNKVRVPNLLSFLLNQLSHYKSYRNEMSLFAEVIGSEISNSSQEQKIEAAGKLKKILEEVRRTNITDYVKIINCSGCCDVQQFRVIVNLTQKLPEADQRKCLSIISKYMSEHPDSPETDEVPADVLQMVDRVSIDRQFDGLFPTSHQFLMPPPAKRVKTEVSSPILNTIGRNEKHISSVLVHKGIKTRVEEKLCKNNMAIRLVESFYIAIYLPMKYENETDMSVCMAKFYNMLFSHLKTQDNFKQKKFRDEPWIVAHPIGLSRSRSKKMVGTLRSFVYNTMNVNCDTDSGIDVQVSIEKILDTLLEFSKVTPEASMDLLVQLLQCVTGRGFDPRCELSRLLVSLLTTTPQLVDLARQCVDQLSLVDGFMKTVEELKKSTLGSEGEQLFRLLHEETKLRLGGPLLFVLGTSYKEDDDVIMSEKAEFSIEGLVSAFQKLSNWDELTYQERKKIGKELPPLWTDRTQCSQLLDQYTDTNGWFGHLVQLYHQNRKDVMKWLRIVDKWPRRQFLVSSIIEAMEWNNIDFNEDDARLPCNIQQNDCLVEWAGRLIIRAAYEKSMDKLERESEDEILSSKLSRSHELKWCESANERGLYNLAISVIKRNHLELDEYETLNWLEQKMLASTMMAFELNDRSAMEKTLETAQFLPEYYKMANTESVIGVNKLIMDLHYRLQTLTSSTIDEVMLEVDKQRKRMSEGDDISTKNKENLASLYETAVLYYDGFWDKDELSKDEIIMKMCEYLGRLDQTDAGGVTALILNRLASCDVIGESTAAILLAKIKPLISKLPSCYIDLLKEKLHLFPTNIVNSCDIAELEEDVVLERYKQSLQLLCHADYLLLQYCHDLIRALQNDTSEWDAIFSRMMRRIFENTYAGADYQALNKYKNTLYAIRSGDLQMKRIVIKGIIQELETTPNRETIRLTHVCPSLTELGRGLERLLRLPAGVLVVKIEEELRIFTDSKQRPCVVTIMTSDGKKRRYLHKNEDLRADAVGTGFTLTPYTVIPLSEDCGLIEFLEDHRRIRDLIASTCDIEDIPTRQAAKDEELVLASKTSSLQSYNEICSKIPAYAMRSAIEKNSASIQDFITKKRRFLDTLSDITINNWLFGLGDRHLQNLLYSIQDGGIKCIDWGAILQYGDEIPPARLTRNILAVCDFTVLESKLQKKLSSLRNSRFMIPILKLSFRWMEDFNEKLPYIEGILQGKMVAHQITKDVIEKSNWLHKTKYIQLLDAVFENHVDKEIYSIEEQVSCLLLQCTDPWILSVTRSGWEPWL